MNKFFFQNEVQWMVLIMEQTINCQREYMNGKLMINIWITVDSRRSKKIALQCDGANKWSYYLKLINKQSESKWAINLYHQQVGYIRGHIFKNPTSVGFLKMWCDRGKHVLYVLYCAFVSSRNTKARIPINEML